MPRIDLPAGSWHEALLRGGLGRRILLWFLVLSLIPLFLSNTVGYLVTRRIIDEQVQRFLAALTDAEAQHVASEVERHQLFLEAVAAGNRFLQRNVPEASKALRAGRREDPVVTALHEHLDRKLGDLEPVSELFVLDSSGVVVAATRHARLGEAWSETRVFAGAVEGRFFGEGWETERGQRRPVYHMGVPIRGEDGHWVGVLVGAVGFDRLQMFLRVPAHLAGDVHGFIVDAGGRLLFVSHVHETTIDYSQRFKSPLIDRPAGSSARYVNYEGTDVLGNSIRIPGMPWYYISEVSVASAFGQLRSLAILAVTLESVFALLLVGLVWIVARSIVAPLRRLVVAAEHIRAGDLGVKVQIERDDELGRLGHTFNEMSSALKTSARQIEEFHEQEMRRAAQLASVGELASGIAHEIKNPLVGLASGIDLLSRETRGNPKARAVLDQLRIQAHRMESAIHDLLSYARPKEPRLSYIDARDLADRLISLVRPQADAAGVEIQKSHGEKPARVHVDPDLLTQAMVNLALNGIQAMEPGGVLEISLSSADGEVRISISDNGCGIPADRLQDLFRPFHTTKHQGTGLGLTITRGIVERHGGRLHVESRPGEGSTFTLILSAALEEEQAE